MNGENITESKSYEYLGLTLDKNLNFIDHLEKTFKKISSRIKLLSRVRQNISPYTAETIYKVMILPVMLYCSNVSVGMPQSKKQRFEEFQDRAMYIINGKRRSEVKFPRVNHLRNRQCALEVFKCLNGIAPKAFEHYFTRHNHKVNTRKNNKSVIIPKVRTETGRKTFSFQGAKIFNSLPNSLQTEKSFLRFKGNSRNANLDFKWNFFSLYRVTSSTFYYFERFSFTLHTFILKGPLVIAVISLLKRLSCINMVDIIIIIIIQKYECIQLPPAALSQSFKM